MPSIIPGGFFDLPSTQPILKQHIDKGEITWDDVNLLKSCYQWMVVAGTLGAGVSFPVYLSLRSKTVPPGKRIAMALLSGMTGSFCGFTVGGAAAAYEVNNKMPDSER